MPSAEPALAAAVEDAPAEAGRARPMTGRDFGGTLLRFIDQVKNSPRTPHPAVSPDFWEQVEQSQKLAAIRARIFVILRAWAHGDQYAMVALRVEEAAGRSVAPRQAGALGR